MISKKNMVGLLGLGLLVFSACSPLPSEQAAIDAKRGDTADTGSDAESEEIADEEASVVLPPSGYTCADGSDPFVDVTLKFSYSMWPQTDFCQSGVDYGEVVGVLGADQIQPIDEPQFESVSEADGRIADLEPVIVFVENGDARAYSLAILMWHEIVNDTVGGRPVTVTFCPLCNAAIVFDRTIDGQEFTFGTSGNLRNSDLVMWDRQTSSWWQQFTGEAIVGEMAGKQLEFLPSQVTSWADFKEAYPDGQALAETGSRSYGQNPYVGYDSNSRPFLFVDENGAPANVDPRLFAVERVLGVNIGGEAVAYPFEALYDARLVSDTVGGQEIVIFFQPGQLSALDGTVIENSKDVGSAAAFDPNLDGQSLTFSYDGGVITDNETGSRWNIFGQAISGPLEGGQLEQILAYPHFWFAWAAFSPETAVWELS